MLHEDAGKDEAEWSKTWKVGGAKWEDALERSSHEYGLAEAQVSENDAPETYAHIARAYAQTYTMRAMGEEESKRKGLCERFLLSALSQLDAAVKSLGERGIPDGEVYEERAECYRRLNDCSPYSTKSYLKLMREDRHLAEALRAR